MISVSKVDGPKTVYLYSYKDKYPIAKIENVEYSTIETILGSVAIEIFREELNPTALQISNFLSPLRSSLLLNSASLSSYTYKPFVGITSETDAKEMMTYYEYDAFQRLKNIKDHLGNVISSYDYHYKE